MVRTVKIAYRLRAAALLFLLPLLYLAYVLIDQPDRIMDAVIPAMLCLLVGGLFTGIIMRHVIHPLSITAEVMNRMAQGKLDAEIPFQDRPDEFGVLSYAMAVLKESGQELETLRRKEAESHGKAHSELEQLQAVARRFETQAAEIVATVSAAATELQASAEGLSQSARETTTEAQSAGTASAMSASNIETVAAATAQVTSAIREISNRAAEAVHALSDAIRRTRASSDSINGLAAMAEKIGEVVGLINAIAQQTNLLALNATIESARAGEAGKGFSVVAGEVKILAGQTARATDDIRAQVMAIQTETQGVADTIKEASTVVEQVTGIVTAIAAAVEEQGVAAQEILRNIREANRETQRTAANIQRVTDISLQTTGASEEVLCAAGELSKQSETLHQEVGAFLASVCAEKGDGLRRADRALGETMRR